MIAWKRNSRSELRFQEVVHLKNGAELNIWYENSEIVAMSLPRPVCGEEITRWRIHLPSQIHVNNFEINQRK